MRFYRVYPQAVASFLSCGQERNLALSTAKIKMIEGRCRAGRVSIIHQQTAKGVPLYVNMSGQWVPPPAQQLLVPDDASQEASLHIPPPLRECMHSGIIRTVIFQPAVPSSPTCCYAS